VDADQILDQCEATAEQRKWVMERLQRKNDAQAARAIGLHPDSVYKWPNKQALNRAVELLLADAVAAARLVLKDSAVEAAQTLKRHLLGRKGVEAANSILDRTGVHAVKETKHQHSGTLNIDVRERLVGRIARLAALDDQDAAAEEPDG